MLKRYAIAAALVWTVLTGAFLLWDLMRHRAESADLAFQQATVAFDKDLLARRWFTQHGGVYVPVTPATPPNPRLSHLPERDITEPSGKRLTLLNPEYVTRQLHELQSAFSDARGHLTSLKPINPGNAPDVWETAALIAFENGAPEVRAISTLDGHPYLRLMRPLKTEAGCLPCHAFQGHVIGDIRGGISVAVPLEPFLTARSVDDRRSFIVYGATWLVMLAMMALVTRRLIGQARERDETQAALRDANETLEHRVRERTVELESALMMVQGEMNDRLGTERELEQNIVALSESEHRLRDIMENMPLFAVGLNRNGEIIYCNRTLLEATGWKAEEILGGKWFDLFVTNGATVQKAFQELIVNLDAECMLRHYENEIRTRQGARLIIQWSNTLLKTPDGEVIGTMSMGEDITERRKAGEAARRDGQRFRSLVNISQHRALKTSELRRIAIGEVLSLLDSPLGFWGTVDEASGMLAVQVYTRQDNDVIAQEQVGRPLEQAGIWGEAVRQRMPIMLNEVLMEAADQANMTISRYIAIPVLVSDRVEGVIGVANKASDYTDLDFRLLDQMVDAVAPIIEHKQSEERFRALIEQAPVAIRIGRKVQTIYANPRFLETFGFAAPEEALGMPLTDQYAPEVRDAIADRARRRELGLSASESYETVGMRKDGSRFPVHVATTRVVLEDGPATVAFFKDITERKEAEEKLRSSEERLRGIFDQASVGVIATDLRGRLLTVNPAFSAISGYKDEEVFGRDYSSLTHPDDRERERELFGALQARERDGYSIEKRYVHHDGGTVWISESLAILRGSDGQPQGFTGVVEDITARRQAEDSLRRLNAELEQRVAERTSELEAANSKLEKLATEDGLTGLPNRRHLDQMIDRELSRGLRTADMLSFLMCDVDFFKRYNDRYGHAEGDGCLKRVAAVLRASFKRASDMPARYGGEEFSVIIPNTPPENVLMLAEALRQRIEKESIPHERSDVAPVVTISIGVVSAPITRDRDRAWYIKHADEAMYRSKAEGRNRVTHVAL
jgi:diguanylate cyclase (GGDEF)-like protein/PAS domain S-box-containing protein